MINFNIFRTFQLSDNDCGGILIGDSGVIEYKLFETYNTNEFCVWIVASEKQSIVFNMESSGVREPSYYSTSCDQVVLTEMDPTDGTLGYPFILRLSDLLLYSKLIVYPI